jgi:hypothetical protein
MRLPKEAGTREKVGISAVCRIETQQRKKNEEKALLR